MAFAMLSFAMWLRNSDEQQNRKEHPQHWRVMCFEAEKGASSQTPTRSLNTCSTNLQQVMGMSNIGLISGSRRKILFDRSALLILHSGTLRINHFSDNISPPSRDLNGANH